MLDAVKISQLAQALRRAHGLRAEVEAALRERKSRKKGDPTDTQNWRRVRQAIREYRGPRQS